MLANMMYIFLETCFIEALIDFKCSPNDLIQTIYTTSLSNNVKTTPARPMRRITTAVLKSITLKGDPWSAQPRSGMKQSNTNSTTQ